MRIKYFGWVIAAIATLGPVQAWGGDREIAEQIIERLKINRDSGELKDFTLDMKVDQGVVVFKGSVSGSAQKTLVLKAADGIDGVEKIVDEVSVAAKAAEKPSSTAETDPAAETDQGQSSVEPHVAKPHVAKPQAATAKTTDQTAEHAGSDVHPGFSFREALAMQADAIRGAGDGTRADAAPMLPGQVVPTAATEPVTADKEVTLAVVNALGQAQNRGDLRGFGVDVASKGGVIELKGRAGSAEQRDLIIRIAKNTQGVVAVRESIAIPGAATLPEPPALGQRVPSSSDLASQQHAPAGVKEMPVGALDANSRAVQTNSRGGVPAMAAPYRMSPGAQTAAAPAGAVTHAAPVMGQPVPMAPHAAVGAPRYDSPYLPNYAWPGYAAYPNYAAVTYPQQYSPSAFPYIGPFYPYPQVPLGWRKVCLEWEDGWWQLDFTDR